MEEVIKYFEQLEARLAAAEERNAALESRLAAQEAHLADIENEREQLLSRIAETERAQQEFRPKLAAIVGHLNRMNEILEDAQMHSLEPEDELKPELEPEQEIQEQESETQEPTPESEPEPVEPEPEPESEPEPEIQSSSISEEPRPEIPEEVASPKAAIYGKSVDDIRLAISLGDRFLYQRELFSQNAELMQRTLDDLNKLHSFDEAVEYISTRFQWDTESNTYQQFLVTLHRRFG